MKNLYFAFLIMLFIGLTGCATFKPSPEETQCKPGDVPTAIITVDGKTVTKTKTAKKRRRDTAVDSIFGV